MAIYEVSGNRGAGTIGWVGKLLTGARWRWKWEMKKEKKEEREEEEEEEIERVKGRLRE